ncbi:MAG TPA: iron donor protein CyaY [Acidobacteriaceae bacterium]
MLDESDFRRYADSEVEALKQSLIEAEVDGGFEVEENNGALNIVFEDPPSKFVVTPNTPVRQIWISALATSFKLEWSAERAAFLLPRTGERLLPLTARLINQQLGILDTDEAVVLG